MSSTLCHFLRKFGQNTVEKPDFFDIIEERCFLTPGVGSKKKLAFLFRSPPTEGHALSCYFVDFFGYFRLKSVENPDFLTIQISLGDVLTFLIMYDTMIIEVATPGSLPRVLVASEGGGAYDTQTKSRMCYCYSDSHVPEYW